MWMVFASGRAGRVEPPLARDALQFVHSTLLELDSRARDQVLDGAGHENLAGAGGSGYARSDVDRNPRYLSVLQLALACVNAGADREIELAECVDDRASACDRTRRAVEDRKEAVSG